MEYEIDEDEFDIRTSKILYSVVDLVSTDSVVEEIRQSVRDVGFFAIDTEYDSSVSGGCDTIQIAYLSSMVASEASNANLLELDKPALRTCVVRVFDVKEHIALLSSLRALLTDATIVKVGCGLNSDQQRLSHYDLNLNCTVDIQHLAMSLGYQTPSLGFLSQKFLGLVKGKVAHGRLNNPVYTSGNLLNYAVYDAYLTLECYLHLINYDKKNNHNKVAKGEVSAEEAKALWSWIARSVQMSKGVSYQRITNMVTNNYGPWKQ